MVYDQREHAVTRAFFPDAAGLLTGPFSEALARTGTVTAEDYVVIMTPGHQADYEVLVQVLRTPAKYIGCIGSRKKIAATRERLLADGFSPAEIGRVHAPIGLPIGGETPAPQAASPVKGPHAPALRVHGGDQPGGAGAVQQLYRLGQ